MRQKSSVNRIRIKYDSKVEGSVPSLRVQELLIVKSRANNFDDARREWELNSIVDETAEEFSSCCELCKTSGLKYNFVLYNPETKQTLSVGSTCIIRFQVVRGVVDVESGVALLQNFTDDQHWMWEIRIALPGVMVLTPEARDFSRFMMMLRKYFGNKGVNNPTDEQLGVLMFGGDWAEQGIYKLNRMKTLWYKPGMIETQKSKVRAINNPKEGQTWQRKKTRVSTSLAFSDLYRTDDKYRDKKKDK